MDTNQRMTAALVVLSVATGLQTFFLLRAVQATTTAILKNSNE